ncbi:MAG: Mov34/MPN/PAD-1 family protein, partial [Polyangiales bacterium]
MRIDVAALQAILTAASAAAPREACGLLLGGREGEAAVVVAAPETGNVAANPARAFEMDPGEVVALHGVAAARGLAVIGAWHSHPAGQASPSAEDLAAAWPGHALLIVAGGRARAFVPTPEGARVLPMTEADVAGWAPPPPSRTLSAMGQAPSDPSDIAALARGVVGGERASLARAITLVESVRPADAARARDLLAAVAALRVAAGNGAPAPAHRVGISGVPGVGKSTLI